MSSQRQKVALIIGASDKPERYSYRANSELQRKGYKTLLFNPFKDEIEGQKVYQDLSEVPKPIDLITMYINESRSNLLIEPILRLKPTKLIFNPGAENRGLKTKAEKSDILCEEACTLVMLASNQL